MSKRKELEAIVSIAGQIDPSLQKSIANATKQFGGLKLGIAAVGTAVLATTTALVGFGADACRSAAEFETQIANVATLLDGTEEQIARRTGELGDDILEVSNVTGVATSELNNGLYQIISAVGDSEDAIAQTELAAKAAAAGGAETTDAINLLTAVTKGYGDTSGEAFQKASDLSFMTVKLGQTSFPELAASMGKVVPLASALNVSQEELYGSFAALTGVTGSTAEVATQMKAVMSGLMSPSQNMTAALKSLGYENANAALESLGLQGTLEALGGTVNGDTQALAKMFSSVEAQTAILALAGAQADDFTEKTAAMYEASGATDRAFATQTDTLEYTVQAIKNLGANFKTSVGQTILPIVKDVAQKVLPVIQTGLDNIQPLLSGLYNKASPFIKIIGTLAEKILPLIQGKMKFFASIWESAKPALSQLATKLFPIFNDALSDAGGLFDMIQPVISGFIANLPMVGDILANIVPVIANIAQQLSPVISMVGQIVISLLPTLAQSIQVLAPALSTYLGSTIQYIIPIIQNLINIFTRLCDFITNVFTGNWSGAWESVKQIFSNCFEALVGIAKAPINAVISLINGVIGGINSIGFTIPDWVPGLGGKDFSIDIPLIPMFASGGFTTGPSIAGEAGTEAVLSFDRAYRDENLSYWAKAGRMLGVDDDILSLFERGRTSADGDVYNITFSPQVVIQGSGDNKDNMINDIINKLREEEEEFMDMLEEMQSRRGGEKYVFDG
ncbi:MAG: phage tail tape measure protein [Bacillus sp. (in: Bacteria)]|nr:phage tail tape measure protein [Bacillus sp. (in: firmicutes)]MCM1427129.1 phage tail tape measure protein [Eubacterium sp.]